MFFTFVNVHHLTLSHLAGFKHFAPKQAERAWLCMSITLAPKVLESCSKAQKTWQVL